jgi:hypothetical protein
MVEANIQPMVQAENAVLMRNFKEAIKQLSFL